MSTTSRIHLPLTGPDCLALAAIVGAAQRTAPVARVRDGARPDGIVFGQARHITHEDSRFASDTDDIRDLWLRVTMDSGFDEYWPMSDCLAEVKSGNLVIDYRR